MKYCDTCGSSANEIFIASERKVKVKNEEITVSFKKPVCPYCCAEMFDDDMESYITSQALKLYKKKMRMVASEDLAKYLKEVNTDELAKRISCSTNDLIGATHGALLSKDVDVRLKKDMKKMA